MLVMYVIYEHPSDYPDSWVVRKWVSMEHAEPIPTFERTVHGTLEEARAAVPAGLHRIRAMSEDDPCIVETWV